MPSATPSRTRRSRPAAKNALENCLTHAQHDERSGRQGECRGQGTSRRVIDRGNDPVPTTTSLGEAEEFQTSRRNWSRRVRRW
jgi:hypothetical protein